MVSFEFNRMEKYTFALYKILCWPLAANVALTQRFIRDLFSTQILTLPL